MLIFTRGDKEDFFQACDWSTATKAVPSLVYTGVSLKIEALVAFP